MSEDDYLLGIISKYKAPNLDALTEILLLTPLKTIIESWAGSDLNNISISGSRAKGTAILLSSDIDLFISLRSSCIYSLSYIYNSLYDTIVRNGIKARKQNVSIGIEYSGHKIDLVPAKVQTGYINYHSLYKSKSDSWTQTNISKHIDTVKNSGRINEIIVMKVWKHLLGLDFPSTYLELVVLDALYNRPKNQLGRNVQAILGYLSADFVEKRIVDPSNTNNIISDDLYKYEKQSIANKALECYNAKSWSSVVW